jgi:hypothetical protein
MDRAGQALNRALEQMKEAIQRLERGQNPDDQQDEALDRIDDAQREVERAREEAEEELAREQLAKIGDVIKGLKERQEALGCEQARLQREALQRGRWGRDLQQSLKDLARNQKSLGDETARPAEKRLSEAPVFARLLKKSSEAMQTASEHLEEYLKKAALQPAQVVPDEETPRLQQEALRLLEQLLEVLKPDAGLALRRRGEDSGGGPEDDQPAANGGTGSDGIPPIVQYKLLRALQAEINRRTEEFARQHPDVRKLTQKEQAELKAIRRDQQEVADLLDELTQPPEEGGMP